ncbi:VOC family protein [Chelativorans xinjiangense]|uniref:VOC family protein n=1 Tax=Chelativorans xinjiangense TaxID=2681485 RepID=UPI00135890D4|nr:VOC family protein [Chelativorans xinjiangense]
MLKITLTSVMVDDQDRAEKFYTEVLGFVKKQDFPVGGARWLTVASSAAPDGVELLLEPAGYPFAKAYQKALFDSEITFTAFACDDVQAEYERMGKLGVKFRGEPARMGEDMPLMAVFEDTCGNLIQMYQA